jgi:alpha-1,3/alpha-1,6-mannosyltransferase
MMFIMGNRASIVITDQVSSVNVAVRLFRLAKRKLIFYCHYPDVLLCVERQGFLKRLYRLPFDWIERYTTGMCDILLVNSEFTAETLRATFENVKRKVHVLYPPIDISAIRKGDATELVGILGESKFFSSLNRYERKKDLPLVVEAFADFYRVTKRKDYKLIIAGGYDDRLSENVEVYMQLDRLISKLSLEKNIFLLRNVSDRLRSALLEKSEAVLYSPQFEHFGIVPCEAMALGTPVIAWNNGGPKESIVNNRTGYLCSNRAGFSKAMLTVVNRDEVARNEMTKACKDRVSKKFSLQSFSSTLFALITSK